MAVNWLRGLDLNQRPSGYEPDELPGCSTPRSRNNDHDRRSIKAQAVLQPVFEGQNGQTP
jgi:hypothetical protein